MNEKHPKHSQNEVTPSQLTRRENRQTQRRIGHDRRDMIRFEPNKDDRRIRSDRRHGNQTWRDNQPV
ncbi:hypothetical protein LP43_2527 [Methylophaga thiooxydans]|uniref:Uncharacterized protein n=1 Tax=Methylophaga thiooxydans TaxID=392484 RepID=A0A0A0BB14_9GAMM|nr:hypothetical protein [Methylophaga thiooxydans]KGM05778.1 hypothetical protein LP43_2527 [Methylophaga thiooxydans]